jgi:AbrB family looped-hinge helix DNA binding protein
MRITSKGQVTIPVAIREKAGLGPNTEIECDFDGEIVRIRRARRRAGRPRGARLVAHMRGRGDGTLTTDEIMALTRGKRPLC